MSELLEEKYQKEVAPKLKKELGLTNLLATPRIEKIVVNVGIGDLSKEKGLREQAIKDLAAITGQKPSIRPAKISVAGFNLREGMPVGLKVTLRGKKMYSFLQKLFNIVLPRLRDFRGVSEKSFDKEGNYTLGIEEYSVFPEIDLGKTGKPKGLEVTIVTSTKNKSESKKLLVYLGMPFAKPVEN